MFKYFLTEEGTQWQLLNGEMRAVFQECPTSYCFNDSFIVHSAACLEGGGGVGSGGIRSSFLPWIEYKKRDNLSVFTSHFSFLYRGPHKSFTCYLKSTVDQFDIG